MQKAETSTASSEPAKQKRSQSRPDNCIHPRENIEVAVKGRELTLRTTSNSSLPASQEKHRTALFTAVFTYFYDVICLSGPKFGPTLTARRNIVARNDLSFTSVFCSQKHAALGFSDIPSEIRTYLLYNQH